MNETATKLIEIEAFMTLTLGFVFYFFGAFLTRKVSFLRNYNIPEPVSGGTAAAFIVWGCYAWFDMQISFDLSIRNELLVVFFATIGLNARFSDLLAGGRILVVLLILTILFIFIQNGVGLFGTYLFGVPESVGVLMGSASLIGGHGTAIAWGATIEQSSGFAAADELGIATATLGLICAALLGGPIAKFLIDRHKLQSTEDDGAIVGLPYNSDHDDEKEDTVNHINFMRAMLAAHVAIIIGYIANLGFAAVGLKLPLFVPTLMAGILMSNTIPYLLPRLLWPARTKALAVISDYSLSVFLAMSLMSMQLWTIAGLGGPLIVVLLLQVIAATLFILLILFRLMGSDYTAAVLSAGFAGFALGATPTAIANMSAVTKRYGPAPLAFIVLPMVSAFFVDLANAFIINIFVGL